MVTCMSPNKDFLFACSTTLSQKSARYLFLNTASHSLQIITQKGQVVCPSTKASIFNNFFKKVCPSMKTLYPSTRTSSLYLNKHADDKGELTISVSLITTMHKFSREETAFRPSTMHGMHFVSQKVKLCLSYPSTRTIFFSYL